MSNKIINFTGVRNLLSKERDINGFSPKKSRELRKAIIDAESSTRSFGSVKELIKDLNS